MKPLTPLPALALSLLVAFPFARAAESQANNPPAIAEVHTWGDLLAQKPITFGADAAKPGVPAPTCRFGIDRGKSGLYGAAVLYCLVEGKSSYLISRNYLGPFAIEHVAPGVKQLVDAEKGMTADYATAPMYLFMRIIPLNTPGEHTFNLREIQAGSPVIATAKVTVTKEQAPSWYPFILPEESGDNAEGRDLNDIAQADVTIPTEGIALPSLADPGPIPVKTPPDAKLPLPQAFPAAPDPGIHLDIRGNLLTVKFDKKVVATDPYDLIFLTRWWVNGKPYVPKLIVTGEMSRAIEWPSVWMPAVIFRIKFEPKTLQVKKGDVIAVQLLFCPGGWDYTGPPKETAEMDKAIAQADDDTPIIISRLSPRIEFTYTGDPAAISQQPAKH